MLFHLRLSDRAQWALRRLRPDDLDQVLDCLNALRRNPYRDLEHRVMLIFPLERVYRHAYPCEDFAIAYHIEQEDQLYIDAIGPILPPA